jgi:hypothetical protein
VCLCVSNNTTIQQQQQQKVNGKEHRHQLSCRFDAVFGPDSAQDSVYGHVRECTQAVVDGFNATVFAYGQTGSGKVLRTIVLSLVRRASETHVVHHVHQTHTMFGPPGHVQSLRYGVYPGSLHFLRKK